jgi:hypothetical protein
MTGHKFVFKNHQRAGELKKTRGIDTGPDQKAEARDGRE